MTTGRVPALSLPGLVGLCQWLEGCGEALTSLFPSCHLLLQPVHFSCKTIYLKQLLFPADLDPYGIFLLPYADFQASSGYQYRYLQPKRKNSYSYIWPDMHHFLRTDQQKCTDPHNTSLIILLLQNFKAPCITIKYKQNTGIRNTVF